MPTRRISLANAELFVALEGQGPPLLLIHGFPLNHGMWSGQMVGLAETARVIAPDLRGFGQSTPAEGTTLMAQFADDLAAILDALEISEPVAAVGHSMGGYVLWQFWKRHPARVRKLIFSNSRAVPDTPEAAANRRDLANRALAEGPQPVIEAFLPKLLGPTARREQPALVVQLQAMMASTPVTSLAAALRGMAEREDARPWLEKLGVPTLYLTGEEDGISTPEENRELAQATPNARSVELAGAGHMAPWEQPEAVNTAIRRFLGT